MTDLQILSNSTPPTNPRKLAEWAKIVDDILVETDEITPSQRLKARMVLRSWKFPDVEFREFPKSAADIIWRDVVVPMLSKKE